jgi:hypothetical protein
LALGQQEIVGENHGYNCKWYGFFAAKPQKPPVKTLLVNTIFCLYLCVFAPLREALPGLYQQSPKIRHMAYLLVIHRHDAKTYHSPYTYACQPDYLQEINDHHVLHWWGPGLQATANPATIRRYHLFVKQCKEVSIAPDTSLHQLCTEENHAQNHVDNRAKKPV